MAGTRNKLGPGVGWDELESCYTESRLVRERIREGIPGTGDIEGMKSWRSAHRRLRRYRKGGKLTGMDRARASWKPQGESHSGKKVWSGDLWELRACKPGKSICGA